MTRSSRHRRSLLFVPAVRPDRYGKALATGADAVCIDLEDGVGFEAKDSARVAAVDLLQGRAPTRAEVSLRINDPRSDLGRHDLDAVVDSEIRVDALMLPKVSDPDDIVMVEAALGRGLSALPLIVQLETARGVAAAHEIGAASDRIAALFFGAIDLSADVGCAVAWDALLFARSQVVLAAAVSGIDAIDSPFMDVPALDALEEECRRVRQLGFVGKAAIHPSQVQVIQDAFSPTPEEVAWAHKVIDAYEANKGGVVLVDGQLVERPVVRAAQRVLDAAGAATENDQ